MPIAAPIGTSSALFRCFSPEEEGDGISLFPVQAAALAAPPEPGNNSYFLLASPTLAWLFSRSPHMQAHLIRGLNVLKLNDRE
jgi:hypothetical protein